MTDTETDIEEDKKAAADTDTAAEDSASIPNATLDEIDEVNLYEDDDSSRI